MKRLHKLHIAHRDCLRRLSELNDGPCRFDQIANITEKEL